VIPRIMVVDDERQIRRALRDALVAEGYTVVTAETGEEAVRTAEKLPPDLILLDLGLPGMSGLEVCRELRPRYRSPIVVLSVRSTERDKVAALDLGADDYLTKPFGMDELLARVRAHLRRWQDAPQVPREIVAVEGAGAPPLRIDLQRRTVARGGQEVRLTRTEFEILRFLALNAGRVVTHGMILQHVWGPAYEEDVASLRVHVAHIRRKIERDPARPGLILTELGVGYRFVIPD
jgi:two-component system, OmpR family, KDP operon response regulator KdpE